VLAAVAGAGTKPPDGPATTPVPGPLSDTGPNIDDFVQASGTGTVTSPPLAATGAGAIFVAFVAMAGTSGAAPSVSVIGGGLSWHEVRDAANGTGTVAIFEAPSTAGLSDVTVTSTPENANTLQVLGVAACSGIKGVGTSATETGSGSDPTVSLVTTGANSLVFSTGAATGEPGDAVVPGPDTTTLTVGLHPAHRASLWIDQRNSPVPGVGTTVQSSDTLAASGTWVMGAVELLAAHPAGPRDLTTASASTIAAIQAATATTSAGDYAVPPAERALPVPLGPPGAPTPPARIAPPTNQRPPSPTPVLPPTLVSPPGSHPPQGEPPLPPVVPTSAPAPVSIHSSAPPHTSAMIRNRRQGHVEGSPVAGRPGGEGWSAIQRTHASRDRTGPATASPRTGGDLRLDDALVNSAAPSGTGAPGPGTGELGSGEDVGVPAEETGSVDPPITTDATSSVSDPTSCNGPDSGYPFVGIVPSVGYNSSYAVDRQGYDQVQAVGGVFAWNAPFYGSIPGNPAPYNCVTNVVGMATTGDSSSSGGGYWLATATGGVYAYGNATYEGGGPALWVNAYEIVVAIVADPFAPTTGYWLVTNYGRVFPYGSATLPSTYARPDLTSGCVVVGAAAAPSALGLWLATSCGQTYAYGAAAYEGNTPTDLNAPIVGIVNAGGDASYWMVGADGGIFSFGAAAFYGSMGGVTLSAPVTGIASYLPDGYGEGYWLTGADGGLFAFGQAEYHGNELFNAPPPPPPVVVPTSQPTGAKNPSTDNVEPCHGTDPVDCVSGDFFTTETDTTTPGAPIGFNLSRTYNSEPTPVRENDAGDPIWGLFGPGWTSTWDEALEFDDGNVTVIQGNGTSVTFTPSLAGFSAPAYVLATLVEDPDGDFTFVSAARHTYVFSPSGQLLSVSSADGQETTYSYGALGLLSNVADAYGQSISVTWGTNDRVAAITAPGGLVTSYTYNSAGELASVVSPTGQVTTFAYGGTPAEMTELVSPTATLLNTYGTSTPGQVSAQATNGLTTTYAYSGDSLTGDGSTTITAPDGTEEVESFVDGEMETRTSAANSGAPATTSFGYDQGVLAESCSVAPDLTSSVTCPASGAWVPGAEAKTYDAAGDITSTTDPQGASTETAYNALDEPWCTVDADEYAAGVRCPDAVPQAPPAPGEADPNLGATISFYNASGLLDAETSSLGATTVNAYTPTGAGVPPDLEYCTIDPVAYQEGVTCPAYGATHDPGAAQETFDALGNVVSTTTAGGATTKTVYGDAALPDLPTEVTGPNGDVTTTTYNAAGQVTASTVSFNGYSATTLHAYDQVGQEYCTVAPMEEASGVTCPPLGTGPAGQPTPPTPASDPYRGATIETYDADEQLVAETSPTGGVTEDAYDQNGQLDCTVAPMEAVAGVTCPASGTTLASPVAGSDPYLGATITIYDPTGQVQTVANPLGGITYDAYDQDGNEVMQAVISDAAASPLDFTDTSYNEDGQVTSITTAAGSADSATTLTSYDPNGNAYCTVAPDAYAGGTYQCPTWQPAWINDPPAPAGEYSALPSASQADNVSLTFANDAGDVVESSAPTGATSLFAYDADGDQTCAVSPVDVAKGDTCPASPLTSPPASGDLTGVTTTIYNQAGERISVTNPDGGTTTTAYDEAGNRVSVTNPDGDVTTYCTYGDPCAAGAPSGGGAGSMLYSMTTPPSPADPTGEVTTTTYWPGGGVDTTTTPAGVTYTTPFDDGALDATATTANAGYEAPPTVFDEYNAGGELVERWDGSGTTTYTYDQNGDLTSASLQAASGSDLANRDVAYSYLDTGQLATITYPTTGSAPGEVATYTYNNAGEIASLTDAAGNETAFAYDPDGNEATQDNEVSTANPNGTSSTSYATNADGQPTEESVTFALTSTTPTAASLAASQGVAGTELPQGFPAPSASGCTPTTESIVHAMGTDGGTVDPDGDITTEAVGVETNCGTGVGGDLSFAYDAAGQLTYVGDTPPGTPDVAYDPAGNLTEETTGTTTLESTTNTIDAAGQVTASSPTLGSSAPSVAYGYDSIGAMTTATAATGTTTYTYDAAGQLVGTATSGGTVTTSTYGGSGLLASVATGTSLTQLTWGITPGESLPVVLTNGAEDFLYGPGLSPVEEIATGAAATPTFANSTEPDQPSATVLTDPAGGEVAAFAYDVFGNLAEVGTNPTPFGYEGAYEGTGNGLANMRARYYDPATGSFTTIDPDLAITDQPYAYAGDDPVNGSDPTGDSWWDPLSWSSRTWSTIGIVASVAAIATGVGALAGIGGLGYIAAASSLVSAAVDARSCLRGHNDAACAGAAADAVSGILGGLGAALQGVSDLASGLVGANSFAVGLGGNAWDGANALAGGGAPVAPARPAWQPQYRSSNSYHPTYSRVVESC